MTFKQKIRFVTDSTCDLPQEIVERYQIAVIPCYVNYNDESYADDHVALNRAAFYQELPHLQPYPTTAAMPPGVAEQTVNAAFAETDHLFVITVASELSAVYNVLRLAVQDLPPDRVTIIDGQTTTMGLGFLVQIGAEVAEATGDPAQVKDAILRARDHTRVYAALETLEYVRRSGRVSWATAGIGSLLQIKPIIGVRNNTVENVGRVRTFRRALDELSARVREHAPLDRLAILHACNESGAQALQDQLADIAPSQTYVVTITPTLGLHVGVNAVGVALVSQQWRT